MILTEYDPVDGAMKAVSSEFKAGLERFPVRLSYQDGGIEDVCLTGVEPTWVLNAKRGIISLIQNNMNDFATNRTVSEVRKWFMRVSTFCDPVIHTYIHLGVPETSLKLFKI